MSLGRSGPGRPEWVSRTAPHPLCWRFSRVGADRVLVGRSRGFDASLPTPVSGCGCRSRAARWAMLENRRLVRPGATSSGRHPNSTPQTPSRVRPNPDHPRRREVARRYCVARNTPCLAGTSPLSVPRRAVFRHSQQNNSSKSAWFAPNIKDSDVLSARKHPCRGSYRRVSPGR